MSHLIRTIAVAVTLAAGVSGALAMDSLKDAACSGSITPRGIFDCR